MHKELDTASRMNQLMRNWIKPINSGRERIMLVSKLFKELKFQIQFKTYFCCLLGTPNLSPFLQRIWSKIGKPNHKFNSPNEIRNLISHHRTTAYQILVPILCSFQLVLFLQNSASLRVTYFMWTSNAFVHILYKFSILAETHSIYFFMCIYFFYYIKIYTILLLYILFIYFIK